MTNRYLDMVKVGPGDRIYDQGKLLDLATLQNTDKLRRLAALASAWNMELSQLVLAYTLILPGMGPVIPATSSLRQLESNARVGLVQFSAEQQAAVYTIVG